MPGAGVNEENVLQLVKETGVNEIHFSAKRFIQSKNLRHNPSISFIDALPTDSGKFITDSETIQKIKKLLE
jgi:copper homeostasis protein CutC